MMDGKSDDVASEAGAFSRLYPAGDSGGDRLLRSAGLERAVGLDWASVIAFARRDDKLTALLAHALSEHPNAEGLLHVAERHVEIKRRAPERRAPQGGRATSGLRILFLTANPLDTQRLSVAEELRQVQQAIASSEHRALIDIVPRLEVQTADLTRELMAMPPDILHFSGEGAESGEILLSDGRGGSRPLGSAELCDVLRQLGGHLRVVVLNACFSKALAADVTREVDCAIGMSRGVADEAAICFSVEFYRALGFGRSVREAFDIARLVLRLQRMPDRDVPSLAVREGIDPDDLGIGRPVSRIDRTDAAAFGELLKRLDVRGVFAHTPRDLQKELESFIDTALGVRKVVLDARALLREHCPSATALAPSLVPDDRAENAWFAVLSQAPLVGARAYAAILFCALSRTENEMPLTERTLYRLLDG